ncbi:hypothetical protein C9374_002492 [Naegleria lovaniensis]|uniref:Phospholipid/glycerol acyltransferase domain-containing protein n=1 Tax=Naegleria lovaniensis TaxID=51637 RepID=A0AA88GUV6_NAELO|nr:uncharacterized protein C9374_002492 [Naegleria lovaniensis]KAG2386748.1 hypothetical protein C9374_002492 [Naegleria lovaniensis]
MLPSAHPSSRCYPCCKTHSSQLNFPKIDGLTMTDIHSGTTKSVGTNNYPMIEMHSCFGSSSSTTATRTTAIQTAGTVVARRLKLLKRHLNISKWFDNSHQTRNHQSLQQSNKNQSISSSKHVTDPSIPSSETKKKNSTELFRNLYYFSKWMLINYSEFRNWFCQANTDPLIRLKDRIVTKFVIRASKTTSSLSEKEQLLKDYIILSHLYLIHPIIVFFCKLFFWALFNQLTVLYESDLARNLQQLNAFEYYKLMNNENPNMKVSKSLTLHDEQLIKHNGPYIFAIGNQRSLADGIVELAYKTQNSVTIMNIEMALFPFFGWISYGVGSEVIIRQLPNQSWNVLDYMRKTMKRGLFQTYIYPEGARQTSDSRELLPYKMGLFMLAIETQASIVPVIHYGIDDIWPYDDWRIYSGNKAYVVIGEPISTKGMVLNQRFELMELYRTRIKEMIQHLEERKGKHQIDKYYKKL